MSKEKCVSILTSYQPSMKYIFKALSPAPNLEQQFCFVFASLDIDKDPIGKRLPRFFNKI